MTEGTQERQNANGEKNNNKKTGNINPEKVNERGSCELGFVTFRLRALHLDFHVQRLAHD